MPILLILLLGAIDFGRLFFGWVNLHQAVRIGANFAATNQDMATERDRYVALIEGDLEGLNCERNAPIPNPTYTTPDGTPVTVPTLGDYATVTLDCEFSPITPLGDVFFGDPIAMSATSTFPIREGCITCPEVEPEPPPPTPLQCRLVPDMDAMSVAGARLAWESAGFDPTNVTVASGGETSTVASAALTEDDPLSNCEFPTYAIFSSSVLLSVEPEDSGTGCTVVPNLVGIALADGIDTWTGSPFTGAMTVDGGDPATADPTMVITSQATTPTSEAGVSCMDTAASMDVQLGPAWPTPPPAPCRVPNMINLFRAEGQVAWAAARFDGGNFSPTSGQFKIRAQSLVGGTYVPCDASIVVADKAN